MKKHIFQCTLMFRNSEDTTSHFILCFFIIELFAKIDCLVFFYIKSLSGHLNLDLCHILHPLEGSNLCVCVCGGYIKLELW